MAGPRTEVPLRQLEELIRRCDLVQLVTAIGRKNVPSDEEHELHLAALAAGGEISARDILDEGVFVVLQLRMEQCHVKRWIDDIMRVVLENDDPLGLGDLATHRPHLEGAPEA
jgi:hypothetical protein